MLLLRDLQDDAGVVLCSLTVDEYALPRIARSSFVRNFAGRDLQGFQKFKAAGGAIHSETHSAFRIVVEDSDISENRAVGGNAEGGAGQSGAPSCEATQRAHSVVPAALSRRVRAEGHSSLLLQALLSLPSAGCWTM